MGQPSPLRVSSHEVLEGALRDAIIRLKRGGSTMERRALLVEARRLKSVIDTWHAIPPPHAARREMLARVMQLASIAGPELDADAPERESLRTREPLRAITPPPVSAAKQILPPASAVSATRLMRHVVVSDGISVTRTEALEWRPFPRATGVSIKVLHRDYEAKTYTALVYLAPGAEMPRHRHASAEDLYVVEGTLDLGDVQIEAGDYSHADAGSIHDAARTSEGCTLLLIGSERDEILDG